MKSRVSSLVVVSVLVLAAGICSTLAQTGPQALNRVDGRVTDESNNGVYNAYVELYNNLGAPMGRDRTTGQGRFSFKGMGPGRYTVVVKPYGTNLMEESKEITIDNSTQRSDTVIVDFVLRKDDRFQRKPELGLVGTIFAQEVPAEAKRLYKSGTDSFDSQPDRAIADLQAAVKMFPTYFDALAALGKAYVVTAKYAEGYPYLLRALDVNRRCSDCYYSLSLAFYKLDQGVAAGKAIDAAVILQPKSGPVRLLQGMICRMNNDLPGAEKALLLAISLFTEPNPEVHWQLSTVYNRLKRNQDAADQLELYLKTKSNMSSAEKENVRDLISKLRKST